MAIQVPVYKQRVELSGVPGYRQNINNPVPEAMGNVGEGITRAGIGFDQLHQRITAEQDTAAVQDAYAKLSTFKQEALDDPDNGFIAHKGQAALEKRDAFVDYFDKNAQSLAENLNDRQKAKFQGIVAHERTSYVDSIDRYVSEQSDVVAKQKLDGSLTAALSDGLGAAARGEYDKIHSALGMGLGAIDESASSSHWDPTYAESKRKEFATNLHLGVLDGMVERGQATMASQYLKDHREEMDASMVAKSNIEKSINGMADAEAGARMARSFVTGAATPVVRSWDPTPIQHIDPSKAFAALAKIEDDPAVPEKVKQAAREHTESLVRNSEQAWKSTLDDVYSRAITKLSQNDWHLSDLNQEHDFLLSDGVNGGRVWQEIIDTRDKALHRKANEAATPEQRAAMVRFLVTLPDRLPDYINPNNKDANGLPGFMREWAPQLSSQDYEQAAGYVARSGVTAAKPDETLSAPTVARIKQIGAEGGLWGQKGPKSDDDNRRYLGIYNELLTKQAELKRQGKPLDDKTASDIINAKVVQGKIPGTGLFVDDTRSRIDYETSPDYAGKPFIENVPDDFRKQANAKLVKAGIPNTDDYIRYLWNKSRGVPDAQNPRPPPPKTPSPVEVFK